MTERINESLTPDEIRALPAITPAQETICAVFGIGPSTYFDLLRRGKLPVETFHVGRLRKVRRADILDACGIKEAASVA